MNTVGLIQAHHLGWDGARDFSLAKIEGKYAIEHVIERLKAMPEMGAVVIAVPEDPGNVVFEEIARAHGVAYFAGSKENVLERAMGAIDSVQGELVFHVMGQHCFTDTALMVRMSDFMQKGAHRYVSMPDGFSAHFAGKVYLRNLLTEVATAIEKDPATRERNAARFTSYVENNRETFDAAVFTELPHYDDAFLRDIQKKAQAIFVEDRLHVVPGEASTVSNPLMESYEFAARTLTPRARVLDIACGDGFGCTYLAGFASEVVGADLDAPLIAELAKANTLPNLKYEVQDACALSYLDASFDAVASRDTIEHIPLEKVRDYLRESRRVLAPGGAFICSTPQNLMGGIPVIPWHVKEYSVEEFRSLLGEFFSTVKIYGSKSGGALTEDERGEKMLAVCRV